MNFSLRILKGIAVSIYLFVEFILAFLILYLNLAFGLAILPSGDQSPETGIAIYIKTNGVHTDVCLPVNTSYCDWRSFIDTTHFPYVKKHHYISFGWGDKGFFLDTPTWADLTFSTAFKAAFLPSETAMHVQYFENEPNPSATIKRKFTSPEKYLELIAFVKESFKKNSDNSPQLIPNKGYWSDDNFYEANGSYHLFKTCNRWTNKALKIAGIETSLFALFSDGIMRHLD